MKTAKKRELLAIFLAAVMGAVLLAALLVRTFLPRMILPRLDGPAMVLLTLVALVLDHYLVGGSRRDYRLIPLYGAFIFGVFPYAATFTTPAEAGTLALLGAVMFTVGTFLFDTMTDRLSDAPCAKIAPLLSAFGLYLAAQCLMGIV